MDNEFPYFNRELSWLAFNGRVLAIAGDADTPLLERVKFLAIHGSNLDEFFQVRVAGIKNQVAAGYGGLTVDGRSPTTQLTDIRTEVLDQYTQVEHIFHDELVPALREVGIEICNWTDLAEVDHRWLEDFYRDSVFPILTPLAVDLAHPFPYISNLSLNLAVFVRHPQTRGVQFARVKVPPILPRLVRLPDERRFIPLEQVIAHHLDELFPGMEIVTHTPFRVTRDADMALDDDQADDLLEAIESQLSQRRFGSTVRIEIEPGVDAATLDLLQNELQVHPKDFYEVRGPLGLASLWDIYALDHPALKYPTHTPVTPPAFQKAKAAGRSMFNILRTNDVLVHHPYESFAASVEDFITAASRDPLVKAIKMTLYRTSDDSSIMKSLIQAAESGKQVVVLVELKARFDEQANIEWAKTLERAGVHVTYGLVGLKTHTKTTLIVRQEGGRMKRYGHIGTGNYNSKTARIYEDFGLFTADPDIGADLTELFNTLTGYSARQNYRKLVVAPQGVRESILQLIDIETSQPDGHIVMKMNSLVDPRIIEALYGASRSGTRVDLIIRGICCLVPGVEGVSENISVRSIVGRYLEHSRVYRFGSPDRGFNYLIGSADMMPRNLDGRVEALVPVTAPHCVRRLNESIDVYLSDDRLAWTLDQYGGWHRLDGPVGINSHLAFESGAAASILSPEAALSS